MFTRKGLDDAAQLCASIDAREGGVVDENGDVDVTVIVGSTRSSGSEKETGLNPRQRLRGTDDSTQQRAGVAFFHGVAL